MKTLVRVFFSIALFAAITPFLMAQWPNQPTPNVPKNAAGQPDMNGPAPRTADGKPDLSGIWNNGGGGGGGGNRGAGAGGGGAPRGGAGAGGGAAGGGAAAGGGGAAPRGGAGAGGGAAGGGAAAGGGGAAPRGGAGAGGGAAGGGAAAGAQAGGRGAGRGNAAASTLPPGVTADGSIPNASFGNVGSGFPGGLPYQKWAADLVAQRKADFSKDNPDAHCLPMGFMQFHTHPEPRKIVQTPGLVLIIYEANSGLRQIYTDGRQLPSAKDVQPWWYGYSVGKWEGDTLVVKTTGFIDQNVWLDVQGSPLSDEAVVTEKFRRPTFGNLEIEVTVEDPKAYTKTWTVKVNQRILLDTELIEFICEDRDATHYVGAK